MKSYLHWIVVLLLGLLCNHFDAAGQTGCPGCSIALPMDLPEDTIFLSEAPTGRVGEAYDGTISFRLPKSTDPVAEVDPNTAPGISLDKITIKSISNLPPGLAWEANQLEFNVREETDGCMRFCGNPLQPGIYLVEVVIEARVLIINQTTFFSFPIEILPAESTTEGFSLINRTGCDQVETSFVNNISSEGREGFQYSWDFGNGQISTEENPGSQQYDEPGTYQVRYQAVIDTGNFILTKATLKEVDCTDILGRPDLRLKIFDPNDEEIYTSVVFDNAEVPLTIEINLPIDTGTYRLQVIDEDTGIGGDANCGEVNFSQSAVGTLTAKDFEVELELFNLIDTIISTDTITVFEGPMAPEIQSDNIDMEAMCVGDTVVLQTDIGPGQWYRNGIPVAAEAMNLSVAETGDYWFVYTNAFGCQATSESYSVLFNDLPAAPVFTENENLLELFDQDQLPESYSLAWQLDGAFIPDANELSWCANASGRYQLLLTDNDSGCSNSYGQQVNYDPSVQNCNLTSVQNEQTGIQNLSVFPNPTKDLLNLDLDFTIPNELRLFVLDLHGRVIHMRQISGNSPGYRATIDLQTFPSGIYLLRMEVDGFSETRKIVKQ